MNNTKLTDRDFWLNYWESKNNLAFEVTRHYPFITQIEKLIQQQKLNSMLEVGGFPGYFSVWVQRNLGVPSTLFDYVIHEGILHQLEEVNKLPKNTIGTIEADLFDYESTPLFDLAVSNGLIEHFSDTTDIIRRHAAFVKPGGMVFITLPNFKGLNGWFQRTFDPDNYAKHNIECMDKAVLRKSCVEAGLTEIDVRYDGRFMLWLENENEQPFWVNAFRKTLWLPLKVLFKLIPIETKLFSPYLVVTARV